MPKKMQSIDQKVQVIGKNASHRPKRMQVIDQKNESHRPKRMQAIDQ